MRRRGSHRRERGRRVASWTATSSRSWAMCRCRSSVPPIWTATTGGSGRRAAEPAGRWRRHHGEAVRARHRGRRRPGRIRRAHGILHRALGQGVQLVGRRRVDVGHRHAGRWGWLGVNAASSATPPARCAEPRLRRPGGHSPGRGTRAGRRGSWCPYTEPLSRSMSVHRKAISGSHAGIVLGFDGLVEDHGDGDGRLFGPGPSNGRCRASTSWTSAPSSSATRLTDRSAGIPTRSVGLSPGSAARPISRAHDCTTCATTSPQGCYPPASTCGLSPAGLATATRRPR